MKKFGQILGGIAMLAMAVLIGCSDADMASYNLSQAAEKFEINRRIVFYDGITGTYMLEIIGRCSIEYDATDVQLEVTCKVGPGNEFKKHFLGLSDNVTYFAEQIEPAEASPYHYRVIFKPQSILPDIEVRGDVGELLEAAPTVQVN